MYYRVDLLPVFGTIQNRILRSSMETRPYPRGSVSLIFSVDRLFRPIGMDCDSSTRRRSLDFFHCNGKQTAIRDRTEKRTYSHLLPIRTGFYGLAVMQISQPNGVVKVPPAGQHKDKLDTVRTGMSIMTQNTDTRNRS